MVLIDSGHIRTRWITPRVVFVIHTGGGQGHKGKQQE